MGGVLGDRIGRIKTMIVGSLWVLFGAALQCSAQNIAWYVLLCVQTHAARSIYTPSLPRMCCARIINGIGTGYLNAIVPVWSAEVATHTSRGAFIASEFTLNIFGVVVAYWLEFGLGFVGDGTSQVRWRVRFCVIIKGTPLDRSVCLYSFRSHSRLCRYLRSWCVSCFVLTSSPASLLTLVTGLHPLYARVPSLAV